MKTEIYQRYREFRTIRTKAGETIKVAVPCGVFVALKKNNGQLAIGQSLLHKTDRFDLKTGLNQARKHASKASMKSVNVSPERANAYDAFIERAKRYFGIIPKLPRKTPEPVEQKSWKGKAVTLKGEKARNELDPNFRVTFYYVVEDNGNTVDCLYGKQYTVGNRVFQGEPKTLFDDPYANL
jgi:hypothetical protein